jgi:transposase InsO family protein
MSKSSGGSPTVAGTASWAARPGVRPAFGAGYAFIHTAVDDHSRLAYSQILPDERKETAVAFWERARAYYATCGITVARVLTDNGAAYKSFAWRDTLTAAGIVHKRTRPYRPQTNGKVERFNRTLLEEWAYARPCTSETERRAAYPDWLHMYNHHRWITSRSVAHPPAASPTSRDRTPRAGPWDRDRDRSWIRWR